MSKWIAWVMFLVGLLGGAVTIPLWLMEKISDRAMLGITLTLSWAALWYEGYNAIQIAKKEK